MINQCFVLQCKIYQNSRNDPRDSSREVGSHIRTSSQRFIVKCPFIFYIEFVKWTDPVNNDYLFGAATARMYTRTSPWSSDSACRRPLRCFAWGGVCTCHACRVIQSVHWENRTRVLNSTPPKRNYQFAINVPKMYTLFCIVHIKSQFILTFCVFWTVCRLHLILISSNRWTHYVLKRPVPSINAEKYSPPCMSQDDSFSITRLPLLA